MGKLIVIVGSTGVGKTALARALCRETGFTSGLEGHAERPFQARFKADRRFALANQMDYLLLRAEQETGIRSRMETGVLDGGLEMDFHGFTRLFHARGWLTDDEFDLCRRFYTWTRSLLLPPDLVLHLTARPEVIARRLAKRDRINIASAEDISLLDAFLAEWLAMLDPARLLALDVSEDDPDYQRLLPGLVSTLQRFLVDKEAEYV
ncbi:MAG: putative deoxynucleoside kinase [Anaerolineaceae bacterium]|nr:MAG: putative deoxynucleoside kinase [Anaerolineaceae bacterium]